MSTDIEQASRAFNSAAESLPTLYHLGEQWDMLLALYEDPEADPAAIEAELARLAGDITRKAYGVAAVIRQLEGMADLQKAEAQRLAAKAKATSANADRLKDYARRCMQQIGIERLETGTFTLAVRQNPHSVVVLDAAAVPSEYTRTTITVDVDKRGILAAFKESGEIPPGVNVVRTESLRIT